MSSKLRNKDEKVEGGICQYWINFFSLTWSFLNRKSQPKNEKILSTWKF
jgi:hypothetical protein